MSGTHVSGAELGRRFSVSRQAIHAARKAGRLDVAGYDDRQRPLFDVDAARRVLAVDAGQAARPAELTGGRPRQVSAHGGKLSLDSIGQAAAATRRWMRGQSVDAIAARRAETKARLKAVCAQARESGLSPGSALDLEMSCLEMQLLELHGIHTDRVPSQEDCEMARQI